MQGLFVECRSETQLLDNLPRLLANILQQRIPRIEAEKQETETEEEEEEEDGEGEEAVAKEATVYNQTNGLRSRPKGCLEEEEKSLVIAHTNEHLKDE